MKLLQSVVAAYKGSSILTGFSRQESTGWVCHCPSPKWYDCAIIYLLQFIIIFTQLLLLFIQSAAENIDMSRLLIQKITVIILQSFVRSCLIGSIIIWIGSWSWHLGDRGLLPLEIYFCVLVLAFVRSGSPLALLWGAWTHGFLLCHRNLPHTDSTTRAGQSLTYGCMGRLVIWSPCR